MKRIINLLIILSSISFVIFVTSGIFDIACPFKLTFGIRCPGCGLTRSFLAIYNLKFKEAFNYNILGIPLFIFFVVCVVSLSVDIILNKLNTINFINKILGKYYVLIIISVLLSMIINNIRGI